MNTRPLLNLKLKELQQYFEENRSDRKILSQIFAELKHRTTSGAAELRQQVEQRLSEMYPETARRSEGSKKSRVAGASTAEAPEDQVFTGTDGTVTPSCPTCGSTMTLRTATRGANAGNQFWGCSRFPTCRGTLPFNGVDKRNAASTEAKSEESSEQKESTLASRRPVRWVDRSGRGEWVAEYTAIGSMPGFVAAALGESAAKIKEVLADTFLLSSRLRARNPSEAGQLAAAIVTKLMQRGRSPLPTLELERAALEANSLATSINAFPPTAAELGYDFRARVSSQQLALALATSTTVRAAFALDDEFRISSNAEVSLFDSEVEEQFLTEWVPRSLGPEAGHWFLPQVSLDTLLEARGLPAEGSRRIDFLFCYPSGDALAIEIDGTEHAAAAQVDQDRDDRLAEAGIHVVRIANREVRAGRGPNLDRLAEICKRAMDRGPSGDRLSNNISQFSIDCTTGTKLQFAIVRAIQAGWLRAGKSWTIDVRGADAVALAAMKDILELLKSIDDLYGLELVPNGIVVQTGRGLGQFSYSATAGWSVEGISQRPRVFDVAISVEMDRSPFHEIGNVEGKAKPDIIIRPAPLPVPLTVESRFFRERPIIALADEQDAEKTLTTVLRHVFRKRNFRPLQARSILNALRDIDSVVLLPTGAGKSIIYQLAGLLRPGITLVVDPIIALIEDQVEGLQQYGIDRAAALTSASLSAEGGNRLLYGIERGEYMFVLHSPERLQSPAFRGTMRAMAETSVINLAVIDEAHCVSEWGHDFRPAYLNLGRNIRALARDQNGTPPALLALTGTASRSVLRDVLTELDIDRTRSDRLIRPPSFDRKELKFQVVRPERTADTDAALRAVLHGLPSRFGMPDEEFYRSAGRQTCSGIIFVPTVGSRSHGVLGTVEQAKTATRAPVTYFSGKPPKGCEFNWEDVKRENVRQFKANSVPLLVSTKAFGMGIDKSNIRYIIHMGMPGSLEAYYQEAGRAGRDRQIAHCLVIYSEFDAARTDSLLDPKLSLDEVRERLNNATKDRRTGDDVTRALLFHLDAFSGLQSENEHIRRTLIEIGSPNETAIVELPFWKGENGGKVQEKSIFRLVKVGVISDYEVLYGSQKFRLYVPAFDAERCRDTLMGYIQLAQPSKAKLLARQVEHAIVDDPLQTAANLAELLIEFTYDVIERSRRNAIREAVLLAREGKTDLEIRQRLLAYLQDGVGSERFDALLDETELDLAEWREILDKIHTPVDAGEVRGLAIRSLESFPDHPGLLFVRAASEAMCSDGQETVVLQLMEAAIGLALKRYEVPEEDVSDMIKWLTDLSESRAPALGLPLAVAFQRLIRRETLGDDLAKTALQLLQGSSSDNVRLVSAVIDVMDCAKGINNGVSGIRSTLGAPDTLKLMG